MHRPGIALLTIAVVGAACTRRNDTFLSNADPLCVTASPVQRPTYDADVKPILDAACARCHGDVRRYGAPGFLRFDRYDDVVDPPGEEVVQGAGRAAACACISAVQAAPDSPLRMPLPAFDAALCDSDRETLRNWVNQGAPRSQASQTDSGVCRSREELGCVTSVVPDAPTYADVRPIIAARCLACHDQARCFRARSQSHFRLDVETVERIGCPGDVVPVGGLCLDGAPPRPVERGVGLFEMRGEVLRTAVTRLDESLNLVPPMPYQPPYAGSPRALLPDLCANDIETLLRWITSGRRTGSQVTLEAECISEAVPARPTWRMDAGRILAARCGLCHGERNRAGIVPAFRLDRFTRERPEDPPGVVDTIVWCVETLDPSAAVLVPFPLTQQELSIVDGAVEILGKRFPVEEGPCEPGGAGAKHARLALRVFDLIQLLAIDHGAMPLGADQGMRAPLCESDRDVLRRWAEAGLPFE